MLDDTDAARLSENSSDNPGENAEMQSDAAQAEEIEKLLHRADTLLVEADKLLDSEIRELYPVRGSDYDLTSTELGDGATLDVGRVASAEVNEQREVPADYFTQPFTDANGWRNASQLEVEKLTPEVMENIVGDPAADMKCWHLQETPTSCAIASQEFAMDALDGKDRQEGDLVADAAENGWMVEGGTPPYDVGKVAELHGFNAEQMAGCTVNDIERALAAGEKVIVGINSSSIAYPELKAAFPDLSIFQTADHAVQVIGLDYNDPDNTRVILNDPGRPDGCGSVYSLSEFQQIWDTSNNFMTTISK